MGFDVRNRYLFSTSICKEEFNTEKCIATHKRMQFDASACMHTREYLFVIPFMVKSDMFLLFHNPVLYLQHDILEVKSACQWEWKNYKNLNVRDRHVVSPNFLRIQVLVFCLLLWLRFSPACLWWEQSFPRLLAAAPHGWSQCLSLGPHYLPRG